MMSEDKEVEELRDSYIAFIDKVKEVQAKNAGLEARIAELETITDEKVERVAKAIWAARNGRIAGEANKFSLERGGYYKQARAALEAAIGGDDEDI